MKKDYKMCPDTGVFLPSNLADEKQSLKKSIDEIVEKAINSVALKEPFFFSMHAKFDPLDPGTFVVSQMIASDEMPPFVTNQMVFYADPIKGFIEPLWTVSGKDADGKIRPTFNNSGVASLLAKGAIPKVKG